MPSDFAISPQISEDDIAGGRAPVAPSSDLPMLGRTLSADGPFLGLAVQSISLDDGVRTPSSNTDKESSMTRHVESYRYEIHHGNDADFVAYQRKSSDGAWQTISMWMIPDPADH
jgi:hypothetical protein